MTLPENPGYQDTTFFPATISSSVTLYSKMNSGKYWKPTMCQWITSQWLSSCGTLVSLGWSQFTGKVRWSFNNPTWYSYPLSWLSSSSSTCQSGPPGLYWVSFLFGVTHSIHSFTLLIFHFHLKFSRFGCCTYTSWTTSNPCRNCARKEWTNIPCTHLLL